MAVHVVYFSHSGVTAEAAKTLGARLGVVARAIAPARPIGQGGVGLLGAIWATIVGGTVRVRAEDLRPGPSDMVILSFPVWMGRLHPVARGWLKQNPLPKGCAIAAFATAKDDNGQTAFAEVARRAGRALSAHAVSTDADRAAGRQPVLIDALAAQVRALHA